MKTRLAALGAVLLLFATFFAMQPAAAANAPVRVMPLGDSITGSPGCWRALLWNQLQSAGYTNVDFVGTLPPQGCGVTHDGDNEGHGGYLATNIANQNQLPGWLAATQPDVVMMHLGTNDVWSNIAPATILTAFGKLVDQMRASNPNMKILVAQVIPMNPANCSECGQRAVNFNAAIPAWTTAKTTAQSPITVVDQWTGFNTATDTGDGVHPNNSGNQKIAAKWFPSLTRVLSDGTAAVGLHISGRNIVEGNGQNFIMRGVNHEHVWFTSQTSSFANIKALGANTVRVVLGSGKRWGPSNDVANIITLCKQNRMICVLEVHDTTGYGEEGAAASLDEAANYWISQKNVLVGQESYVIINIGNEPIGNNNPAQWTTATANAVRKLRANGFAHLLMVDAPNWGQDWQNVMRDNAQTVWDADTLRNTVFSIHMYAVYNTAASINAYFDAFRNKGLPLVVGEFGWQFASGEVDDQTVMAQAVARGIGYLGWSWAGNNDPRLDMTNNFNPGQLTTWGQRIFNGVNGIKATSKEASIFGGGGSTVRYEAETSSAVCTGTIDTNWTGYSGSGFCNGNNAVGAYAQFTVNARVAGTATLRVRFANGATTARPASLIVNGATVQTPSFEGTGAWNTWVTKTLTVTLNAGSNIVRLNPTTSAGLPNVDYLEVIPA